MHEVRFPRAGLVGSLVLFLLSGAASAQVTAYSDSDYRGTSESFRSDVPDLRRARVGNDSISSLRVPDGCRVEVFADIDFRGTSETVTRDVPDMGRTRVGNDSVSSMRVDCDGGSSGGGSGGSSARDDEVILYSDFDYRGTSQTARTDLSDLRRSTIGNDTLSSMRVGRDCRVELYADVGYGGRSERVDRDIEDMGRTGIGNDSVSSIRIDCGGSGGGSGYAADDEVILYSDSDYRGTSQSVRSDLSDLRRSTIGNDSLSSIRVGRNCRVELFADIDFRGSSSRVDGDVPDLGRSGIGNDSVSSIRVDCYGGSGSSGDSGGSGARDDEVILYADEDYRGTSQTVRSDVSDLRRSTIGNDTLSSIRVGRDCRVEVFEDIDFRGRSDRIDGDVPFMGRTAIGNDNASSLRIDCR